MPKRREPKPLDEPRIVGVSVERPDEELTYKKACAAWRKIEQMQARRVEQRIEFGRGPVCLVFAADLHLGSSGVNYPRVFDEAKIVAETPGMYLVLDGDLLDNFIIPKLMAARHNAELNIQEEWVLVRKYLKVVQHKLLVSVSGNHESWAFVLAGVDYFADVLRETVKRAIIYDTDDIALTLRVGKAAIPARIRHKWRYRSVYNISHGIEAAHRLDGGFLLGVGAHYHTAGLCRAFNANGSTGMAVMCGSYKVADPFARKIGFQKANGSTAQSVILFGDGAMVGIERLDIAADLIRKLK